MLLDSRIGASSAVRLVQRDGGKAALQETLPVLALVVRQGACRDYAYGGRAVVDVPMALTLLAIVVHQAFRVVFCAIGAYPSVTKPVGCRDSDQP